MAVNPQHLHLAEVTAAHFMTVWKHFDRHGNGYIEGKELESFFTELEAVLRGTSTDSANGALKEKMQEFMKKVEKNADGKIEMSEAWRKYDTDRSGFIEANELKLKMFDLNGDGKLGLSEMARLLPVQENFLLKFQSFKLSSDEFDDIFTFYDKDGNGYIDEQELDALLKDLYQKHKMHHDAATTMLYHEFPPTLLCYKKRKWPERLFIHI
ncbi:calretinin [Silurus asotus]|uniref:Calretinin n=1 Tax=Silurus asotus TaxID=30991 RepID=A0AAD5F8U5_SILAS|nr:calretinin [Silurus asotus]